MKSKAVSDLDILVFGFFSDSTLEIHTAEF